jgi:hypothetical protein
MPNECGTSAEGVRNECGTIQKEITRKLLSRGYASRKQRFAECVKYVRAATFDKAVTVK